MKIEDVILFEKILTLGSISAGGKACGLTTTVSSDRLKRLEADLGCMLLNRTTRSLSPTGDGKRFFEYATNLIESYEAARQSVGKPSTTPVGCVTIAAPALFSKKFMSEVINTFLNKYPETEINLRVSDDVQNYAAENIDVGIRISKLSDSNFIAKKISENRRVLCASPAYLQQYGSPSHPAELKDHRCIIFMEEDTWHLADKSEDIPVKVSGRFKTNNAEMATQATIDGQGIALRSLWDIAGDLQAGRLIQVLKNYNIASDIAIYAIYPQRKFISLAARLFVDLLVEKLSEMDF